MDNNSEKDAARRYLLSIGEAQLGQLIYEIGIERADIETFSNGDFEKDDQICAAVCCYGAFEGKVDAVPIVELYAPDSSGRLPDDGQLLHAQGACEKCSTNLLSYSKHVNCPICGDEVWLT